VAVHPSLYLVVEIDIWFAPAAQIRDEIRIAASLYAKRCGRHMMTLKERFDLS
jgi:hypothetical protein